MVTEERLERGIAVGKDGALFRKIRKRISEHAEKFGYAIVDRFVGHGVGTVFHSKPLIFHHRNEKPEPILTLGTTECVTWEDNWTTLTKDGSPAAQIKILNDIAAENNGVVKLDDSSPVLKQGKGESKTNVNKTISGVLADDFDDALSFTKSK
ncbi:methionine aminopeptidase 1B, chloroplastic, partial [Tanacetum coccineum]